MCKPGREISARGQLRPITKRSHSRSIIDRNPRLVIVMHARTRQMLRVKIQHTNTHTSSDYSQTKKSCERSCLPHKYTSLRNRLIKSLFFTFPCIRAKLSHSPEFVSFFSSAYTAAGEREIRESYAIDAHYVRPHPRVKQTMIIPRLLIDTKCVYVLWLSQLTRYGWIFLFYLNANISRAQETSALFFPYFFV